MLLDIVVADWARKTIYMLMRYCLCPFLLRNSSTIRLQNCRGRLAQRPCGGPFTVLPLQHIPTWMAPGYLWHLVLLIILSLWSAWPLLYCIGMKYMYVSLCKRGNIELFPPVKTNKPTRPHRIARAGLRLLPLPSCVAGRRLLCTAFVFIFIFCYFCFFFFF